MAEIEAQQAWAALKEADRLYSSAEVEQALDRMADEITARLADRDPLLVCILNGGVVPFGKLLTRLNFPLTTDYIHATRFGSALHCAELNWVGGPHQVPRGRSVLLVDDIFDEGATLAAIVDQYLHGYAREIFTAVLVTKDRERTLALRPDFSGLTVPNRYVFGYGMDYKGYLRNANGIFAEKD
ncbi:MAG: hypoxanthine-guanine phosphoribosyltransferase [Anaerolineales bacterium]